SDARSSQATRSVDEEEDGADHRRSREGERCPTSESIGNLEQHLRAPLLVEPRPSGDGERVRVDVGKRVCRKDAGARAEVIGEVNGGHVRGEGGHDRQDDGDERPKLWHGKVPSRVRFDLPTPNLAAEPTALTV